MSASELCLYFGCHLLRKRSLCLLLVELILSLLVSHNNEFLEGEFLENNLLVNIKRRKLITKNVLTTKKQRNFVTSCSEIMQQSQDMSTQEHILKIKFDKDKNNNSNEMKMILIVLIQKQVGNVISCNHHEFFFFIILVATVRRVVDSGIGTLHHGMCNNFPDVRISLTRDSDSLASDGGVHIEHLVARIFLMRTVCQVVFSGSHPSFILSLRCTCIGSRASRLKMELCTFTNTVHTSRNMSYITPEMTSTFPPCTRAPSYPSARPTSTSTTIHSGEMNHCQDPQQASIGYLADLPPTSPQEGIGARRLPSEQVSSEPLSSEEERELCQVAHGKVRGRRGCGKCLVGQSWCCTCDCFRGLLVVVLFPSQVTLKGCFQEHTAQREVVAVKNNWRSPWRFKSKRNKLQRQRTTFRRWRTHLRWRTAASRGHRWRVSIDTEVTSVNQNHAYAETKSSESKRTSRLVLNPKLTGKTRRRAKHRVEIETNKAKIETKKVRRSDALQWETSSRKKISKINLCWSTLWGSARLWITWTRKLQVENRSHRDEEAWELHLPGCTETVQWWGATRTSTSSRRTTLQISSRNIGMDWERSRSQGNLNVESWMVRMITTERFWTGLPVEQGCKYSQFKQLTE